MRCPQEAGETAEERYAREHRADEPADKLSRGARTRDMNKPAHDERPNAGGADSAECLADGGDGKAGCGRDEHPACHDPPVRAHTDRTQPGAMRCQGNYPQPRAHAQAPSWQGDGLPRQPG